MPNLQMSLKQKWFDMTKSGEKKEDYREINEYWINRLVALTGDKKDHNTIIDALCCLRDGYTKNQVLKSHGVYLKDFDYNIMTLGYPKSTDLQRILKLKHEGIEIREGNPKWGAEPGKIYFVIKHGVISKITQ